MASAALTCTGRGGNTPMIQAHTPFCCNKNKGQAATKCRYHPTTACSEINHKNKALGASSQLRVSQCFCDKLWATSAMLTARGSIFLCRTGWRELLTHSGRASNTPDCLNLTIKKEHTDISRTWALEWEAAPFGCKHPANSGAFIKNEMTVVVCNYVHTCPQQMAKASALV